MILPLTPLRFLHRAMTEFGRSTGMVCGEQRFSYRQFGERVHRLTGALLERGLAPGDRVAFLSFNCHRLVEAYFGVPQARAILLPLNVRLSAEEQVYILEHSGSRALFFSPEFLPLVDQFRRQVKSVEWYVPLEPCAAGPWADSRCYDELLAASEPAPAAFTTFEENSIAELFYTSGSTGRPKGVMLSHRTLYLHALYVMLSHQASEATVELHTIPMFHANGWGRPHLVTFGGGRHVMIGRFDPQRVLELIARERVTRFCMVPAMAAALIHFPDLAQFDCSSLEYVFLGGAPCSPSLVAAVEQALGCRCYVGYGLTETAPVASTAFLKAGLGPLSEEERLRRQASTGYALPGVEMRLADEEGRDLPRDGRHIGEILVRGDTVMEGYWNEPDETRRVLPEDGWLRTGDMAVWDEDGYFLVVDRKKDIIISGGENISSIEIETVLAAHPAVYEVAVVGVPDEKWGEAPLAYVALKPGAAAAAEELQAYVRGRLAGFKVPREVEIVEALPKGATGKILKRALREPHWAGLAQRVHG